MATPRESLPDFMLYDRACAIAEQFKQMNDHLRFGDPEAELNFVDSGGIVTVTYALPGCHRIPETSPNAPVEHQPSGIAGISRDSLGPPQPERRSLEAAYVIETGELPGMFRLIDYSGILLNNTGDVEPVALKIEERLRRVPGERMGMINEEIRHAIALGDGIQATSLLREFKTINDLYPGAALDPLEEGYMMRRVAGSFPEMPYNPEGP